MNEKEKLIAKMAAKFMSAYISAGGGITDIYYAKQCRKLAENIVN